MESESTPASGKNGAFASLNRETARCLLIGFMVVWNAPILSRAIERVFPVVMM
jgi:hypothetical protein